MRSVVECSESGKGLQASTWTSALLLRGLEPGHVVVFLPLKSSTTNRQGSTGKYLHTPASYILTDGVIERWAMRL